VLQRGLVGSGDSPIPRQKHRRVPIPYFQAFTFLHYFHCLITFLELPC
jgi:hypothetical protein